MFFEASKSHSQMDSRLILVVIGVIAMTFGRSEAITCYACSNDDVARDAYCGDAFNVTDVRTVPCTTCLKYWRTYEDKTTFTRGCYSNGNDDSIEYDECASSTLDGRTTETCLCKTDKCNDGQLVKPTIYNVIIGAAMATVTAIARMSQS